MAGLKRRRSRRRTRSAPVTAEEKESAKRRTERLFGADEPLELTLTADFKATFKSRDTLNVKPQKATLTVKDSSGAPVAIPIEIAPRGHFRLRYDVCNFPPIRLIFPDRGSKGRRSPGRNPSSSARTATRRTRSTRDTRTRIRRVRDAEHDDGLELQGSLAKVTYVPAGEEKDAVTKYGLLIEDESDMAKRNGGRIFTVARRNLRATWTRDRRRRSACSPTSSATRTGRCTRCTTSGSCSTGGRYMPSRTTSTGPGVVFARYAKPDPRLGIPTVQDGLFRGPCLTPDDLAPVLAKFNERTRQDIKALYARAAARQWLPRACDGLHR